MLIEHKVFYINIKNIKVYRNYKNLNFKYSDEIKTFTNYAIYKKINNDIDWNAQKKANNNTNQKQTQNKAFFIVRIFKFKKIKLTVIYN